eukprot:516840-Rhodomonas_salina.5
MRTHHVVPNADIQCPAHCQEISSNSGSGVSSFYGLLARAQTAIGFRCFRCAKSNTRIHNLYTICTRTVISQL